MPELGDLQLLMGDQRLVGSGAGAPDRHFRLQRVDVIWQGFGIGFHVADGITNTAALTRANHSRIGTHPAQLGRNVWRGFRQSMPSSM